MTTIAQHAPGTFCWPELGTSDQAGAKRFYSGLFGWETSEMPLKDGATYTTLKKGGKDVGALYQIGPEQQGMPPSWGSYVAVENADAVAIKAKQLGGTVIAEPMDVFDFGRMAVLQDPTGAIISVWQAKKHAGAGLLDEAGALCWSELLSRDTAKAEAFYTQLFGWAPETMPMTPPYTVFKNQGTQVAGMMAIDPNWGDVPSHWLTYFAVDDCEATVAKTLELGGKVVKPAAVIPNIGTFAIVQDPQGASFALLGRTKA